jgi:hypothetical protein
MTAETVTITLTRYRTPSGKHTCAAQFPDQVCRLYRTQRFGCEESCGWTGELLERENNGARYLQPCHECPLRDDV